jgi:chromate reductase, NAD(P)H dehydrogenase (quinone)
MKNVAVVVGSLRRESINRQLALAMARLRPERLRLALAPVEGLPLFNQDLEAELPQGVVAFKSALEAADGVLFVTPEYNRGLPAVTKNAIDWSTRPRGKSSLLGKPVAIAGASDGRLGTAVAQSHLRSILPAVGAALMGLPEVYFQWKSDAVDADGALTDPKSREFLEKFLDRFADWIERLSAKS